MRLERTDVFATLAVAVGGLVYAMWLADAALPGLGSVRAVGAVVLALGWLASAVAVVPNFDVLIHSSRLYLAATAPLGVAALTAGIVVLVDADEAMLALLVSTTIAMWVLATVRHTRANRLAQRPAQVSASAATTVDDRQPVGAGR
jgi:hypothetical protein